MALMLFLLTSPVHADVISAQPDAAAITIYRDRPATAQSLREASADDISGLAMVVETRTVDLPAGRTRLRFEGVGDGIIPESASLSGLPGGLVERNFDYDLFTPGALIDEYVGQHVTVRRIEARTGKVTEEDAVLRSGPDGLVVDTGQGVEALGCGAGLEGLVFDHIPEGLAARPTLSVIADVPAAGRYRLRLSYLTVRVDWSADYVARIDEGEKTLDLTGWITLSNRGAMTFGDAPTEVVAGHLVREPVNLPQVEPKSVEPECWPMGTTSDFAPREEAPADALALNAPEPAPPPMMAPMAAMVVTAEKREAVVMSQLGDYKLYTLAEPTTVAARQTKQVRFLHLANVRFEKLYVLWGHAAGDGETPEDKTLATTAVLSFENKPADGLGQPLPAGQVSIRQSQAIAGGRELFIGEPTMRDVPVGEPFELNAGQASDVTVRSRTVSDTTVGSGDGKRERQAGELTIANAKPEPVTFELRIIPQEAMKVAAESRPHILKNGAWVWRVTLPANSQTVLTLTLETPA
jgi:hypothetical protein